MEGCAVNNGRNAHNPSAGPEQPLTLFFVRHAQATEDRRDLSRAEDPPLTAIGRRQAARLARRLQNERFSHAYVSVLKRCRETARFIFEFHRHTPYTETADIMEVSRDHFVSIPAAWNPATHGMLEQEKDAMGRFANRLWHDHNPGHKILVVAHGNLIRSLMPMLGGKDAHESILMEINNASVTVLDVWNSGVVILKLANCVRHLPPNEVT